jgi:hypothetical protein
MVLLVFTANFHPFILCKDCTKGGFFSVMLVPNEKIIGQVHFVYQIHLCGGGLGQTTRHE